MLFTRGMRDKIGKYADANTEICVAMSIEGAATYDFCCFGVDKDGKLSDDRYMVFYNQTSSPNREISLVPGNGTAEFRINLAKLPETIDKLVFTANIDGNGTMGEIVKHCFNLSQNGTTEISMELAGTDFHTEKAIISVEIYRKGEWRIAAVANGFNGGLSALLNAFGGTEESTSNSGTGSQPVVPSAPQANPSIPQPIPASSIPQPSTPMPQPIVAPSSRPVPQPSSPPSAQPVPQSGTSGSSCSGQSSEEQLTQSIMGKINLSKDKVNLEKHVICLSKCVVDLSKKSGVDLGSVRAKVVVVLDYSGSMGSLYSKGTVQRTLNRLVPLGLTFDDNGSIDVFLFQSSYRKMDDMDLSNYENYVKSVIETSGYSMGGTKYAPVLKAIIDGGAQKQGGLFGFGKKNSEALVSDGEPTFILFITDGENADRNETDDIIRKSSGMNVFIQFIGIGNERFTYLKKLDDLSGRKRDNTGFSQMKSLDKASDDELYTNVLSQFSGWLKGLQ